MSSKIEQTIDDIYELLEDCKYVPFSNNEKLIVNKEDIYALLEELKARTPEEIKLYQKMLVNRDTIIENAKKQGDEIIAKAQEYQSQMVDNNEIMQQAYAQAAEVVNQARAQAQDMLNSAVNDANNYQMHAIQYTDDSLAGLQDIIGHAINSASSRYDELLSSLNECMDIVSADRAQLSQPVGSDMPTGVDNADAASGAYNGQNEQADVQQPVSSDSSDGIDLL